MYSFEDLADDLRNMKCKYDAHYSQEDSGTDRCRDQRECRYP